MNIIIAILISYFAISLIAFIGIWKDLKKSLISFRNYHEKEGFCAAPLPSCSGQFM